MNSKKFLALSIALALSSWAQATTVVPTDVVAATPFNWASGPDNAYGTSDDVNNQWGEIGFAASGTAKVTGAYPHGPGNTGSLELASNGGTSAKAGIAYYPPSTEGFGTLSSITAASFDWMRAAGSGSSPVMRLFLFEPNTNTHVATLLWAAGNDGIAVVDNVWGTADVLGGKVWNSKPGGSLTAIPSPGRPFADLKTDAEYGPLVVRAVEIGFGTGGWGPDYKGAADNVLFTGDKASVTADFEMVKPEFDVTVVAGANGTTDQGDVKAVAEGDQLKITITPKTGFEVDTVTGCGGTLAGNVYTTGAVTADCEVNVTFKAVTPPAAGDAAPQPVPSLGQWGVMLLGSLMAGFAGLRLRSRK
ncbi:MAG: IPTL-CTERM sorting domain-containing protein [Comamonas sp.]